MIESIVMRIEIKSVLMKPGLSLFKLVMAFVLPPGTDKQKVRVIIEITGNCCDL